MWCRGDILQIDAQITFRAIGLPGLKQLSVGKIKNEDYVSQEKVVFDKLEIDKTMLYVRSLSFYQCVSTGVLRNYYRTSGLLEFSAFGTESRPTRRLDEVYYTNYESSTGKDVNRIKAFLATDKGGYRFWHPLEQQQHFISPHNYTITTVTIERDMHVYIYIYIYYTTIPRRGGE